MEAFNTVILQLQDTDNTIRKEAEDSFNKVEPEQRVLGLCQYLDMNPETKNEVMALVLLRRLFARSFEDLWPKIDDASKAAILVKLLEKASSANDTTRSKYIDVIAQISHETIDEETGEQNWKGVIEFLSHCFTSPDPNHKHAAMLLIENTPNIFGVSMGKYVNDVTSMFEACLSNPESKVRSAAVKAIVSFVTENEDDDLVFKKNNGIVKQMAHLVDPILLVCKHVVETEEDDDGPLQCLADLAATVPAIITVNLQNTIELCLGIINTPDRNESYRHSAMEVIVSYIESARKTMKNKGAVYLKPIIEACMFMMAELDDDLNEWAGLDDDEEEEETSGVGESSLDRIATTLNGKTMMPKFLPVVEQYLNSEDWKKRHAALMAFSAIGEGCQRSMEPNIQVFMEQISKYATDPHPRVRYAACNAIGQMSSDFAPTLQKKSHAQVVPVLLRCLEMRDCLRVTRHAAAALINFCEECPQNVISGYLPAIIQSLEQTLDYTFRDVQDQKTKLVVEQVVTAIASTAEAAQDLFKEYYARLMQPLLFILEKTDVEEFKELRGKTMECISLIGVAVGKEVFHADAVHIMNMLSASMPTLSIEDPQCSYMISSWTRFSTVLGADFVPYLPLIMDTILRAASFNLEYAVVDDQDKQNEESWTYQNIGEDQNFGIRTAGLEEKATACEMLVCYARQLKEHFAGYVDKVAEIAMTNLHFLFHDGVRQAAADVMPCLVECVKHQGVDAMRRLASEFIPELNKIASKEEDFELKAELLGAVAGIIDILEFEGLTPEYLSEIVPLLNDSMKDYAERKKERDEADSEDGEDQKEEIDDELEYYSSYLSRIAELIHSVMKETRGEAYGPLRPSFEHAILLLNPQSKFFERQWATCIMDDAIEFSNSFVPADFPTLVPIIIGALREEYPEVRQAAAYGIGIMALRVKDGIEQYKQNISDAFQKLVEMIQDPQARATEEGTVATENAIAAVTKILLLDLPEISNILPEIIPVFLSWLPTYEDQQESVYIYTFFVMLYNSHNAHFFGANNQNLPKILDIALSALDLNAFDDEDEKGAAVKAQVVELIKHLYTNVPKDTFLEIASSANLDEDKKKLLESLVSQ